MKYFLYSILSGFFLGLGGIFLKYLLDNKYLFLILLDPFFILTIVTGIIGFILSQIALKNIKGSIVSLLSIITMTFVSLIGGNILGEVINVYEIIGIVLMTCSVIIILTR